MSKEVVEYRFDVYQFGRKIDEVKFTNYDEAQRYWLRNYYNYDYADILYLNGVKQEFLETYKLFNTAEMHSRYWSKQIY